MTDKSNISGLLRQCRLNAGLTQQQAAEKAGLTQSNLSMIENGKRRVSAESAAELLGIYGVGLSLGAAEERDADGELVGLFELISQLAESGGDALAETVRTHLLLSGYLLMRSLYLSDTHNSDSLFGLTDEDAQKLAQLLADRLAHTEHSGRIEPRLSSVPDFRKNIARCESLALQLLTNQTP